MLGAQSLETVALTPCKHRPGLLGQTQRWCPVDDCPRDEHHLMPGQHQRVGEHCVLTELHVLGEPTHLFPQFPIECHRSGGRHEMALGFLTHIHHAQPDRLRHCVSALGLVETPDPSCAILKGLDDSLQPVGSGGASAIDADDGLVAGGANSCIASRRATTAVLDYSHLGVGEGEIVQQIERAIIGAPVGDDHLGRRSRSPQDGVE